MRAIVLANGELNNPNRLLRTVQPDDCILAADGGARHALRLGIWPHYVIGDFDSLTADELTRLQAQGATLERHPPNKDETDLELTLLRARALNANPVLVFAALGGRWDMSIANLLLAAHPALSGLDIHFLDANASIRLLHNGTSTDILGKPGDTISLIPLAGDARGITTRGLEYPLQEGTLVFGAARGVSNVMTDAQASVHLREGLLLVVHLMTANGVETSGT